MHPYERWQLGDECDDENLTDIVTDEGNICYSLLVERWLSEMAARTCGRYGDAADIYHDIAAEASS